MKTYSENHDCMFFCIIIMWEQFCKFSVNTFFNTRELTNSQLLKPVILKFY